MAGSRPQSHGNVISMKQFRIVYYFTCTFLPTATIPGTTTAAAATTATAAPKIN